MCLYRNICQFFATIQQVKMTTVAVFKNLIISYYEGTEENFNEAEFNFQASGEMSLRISLDAMLHLVNGLLEINHMAKSEEVIQTYVDKLDSNEREETVLMLYATKVANDYSINLMGFQKKVVKHKFVIDPIKDDIYELCTNFLRVTNGLVNLNFK